VGYKGWCAEIGDFLPWPYICSYTSMVFAIFHCLARLGRLFMVRLGMDAGSVEAATI